MALVTCPDCGHQVSTAAVACPQCNRPIAAQVAVPAGRPALDEEIAWEGVPSLKAMLVQAATTAGFAIGLPVAVALAYDPLLALLSRTGGRALADVIDTNRPTIRMVVTAAVVVLVVVRLAKLAWHAAVLRSHRYKVSNQRILLETGVLSKRIDEVDMRTVEDIEFRQGLLERLLGIGDIAIIAADKGMGRFRLVAVENPRDVRELIRASAFQATQRQVFTRST